MSETQTKPHILRKLFTESTNNIYIQFFRYLFVGGIAFIVDFGTIYLLTLVDFLRKGILYFIPVSVAFILGLFTNYTLSILWIFSKRKVENKKLEFMVFALIGLGGVVFNLLFIWFFTEIVFVNLIVIGDKQVRILVSKIISTVFVYLWNFFARKLILFRE